MRPVLAPALALLFVIVEAASAGPRGGSSSGGSGGGGRLGQVSSGLGQATGGGSRGGGGRGASGGRSSDGDVVDRGPDRLDPCPHHARECVRRRRYRVERTPGDLYVRVHRGDETLVINSEGEVVRHIYHPLASPGGTANVDLFFGAQKIHESDTALSLALSVDDRWFRLAGSITVFREQQVDGTELRMQVPTLMLGVRVDDRRATKAFLEGGVAVVRTQNDPMTNTSITGPIAGIHVEHRIGGPKLVGDAHVMLFEAGVRAYRARLGIRLGHVEAALGVLDFNVGPALFGPEIGLVF